MSLSKASVFGSVITLGVQRDGHGWIWMIWDGLSIDQLLHSTQLAVDEIGTVHIRTIAA